MNTPKKRQGNINCDRDNCFFKLDGVGNNHVCDYCTRNELSKSKERDYSVAIKDSGY